MNLIDLKIVTPQGTKFNKQIEIFNTKTVNGAIGISANQTGLIAKLANCISTIRVDDKNRIEIVVLNGLLYSTKNEIKVFTDYCEEVANINVDEIKKQINELEQQLKNQSISELKHESIEYHIKRNQDILSCFQKEEI